MPRPRRLVPLALLPLLAACAAFPTARVEGSGIAAEETRVVAPFTALDVGGALRVHVSVGHDGPLRLTGDDNLLALVRTRVVDEKLVVDLDGHHVTTRRPLVLEVATTRLDVLDASGATSVVVEGLDGAHFVVDLSGASDVRVTGRADEVVVDASGASDLDLSGLEARTATLDLSGASTVRVTAREELVVDGSGASDVRYRGRPTLHLSLSGASSVRALDPAEPAPAAPQGVRL